MDFREHLELYQELGFSVIPLVYGSKRPALPSWEEYQGRRPTEEELTAWFGGERRNVGVICGEVSDNLVVLDFDRPEVFEKVKSCLPPSAPVVETGRGFQVYLRTPFPAQTQKISQAGIDVRGEGSYVVAPPSLHPNGRIYRFLNPEVLEAKRLAYVGDLASLLQSLCQTAGVRLRSPQPSPPAGPSWVLKALEGVEEGERDVTATRLAGYFHSKGLPKEVALSILLDWAKKCSPPFPEKEVTKCVNSVWKYPGGEERVSFPTVSLRELLSHPMPEQQWLIENILPEEGVLAMVGEQGVGKTWLALHLACSVAGGKPFMERFGTNGGGTVLIVDEENGEKRLQRRLRRLVEQENLPIHIASMLGLNLSRKEWRETLEAKVAELCPKLIIFDSLIRIHRGDENKSQDISGVFGVLSELRKRYGTAIAFTHHMRKAGMFKHQNVLSQRVRGSTDILAYVDSVLAVVSTERSFALHQIKNRDGEPITPISFCIEDTDEDRTEIVVTGEIREEEDRKKQAMDVVREVLQEGRLSRKELTAMAGEKGIPSTTLSRALDELLKAGEVTKQREGRCVLYSLVRQDSQNYQNYQDYHGIYGDNHGNLGNSPPGPVGELQARLERKRAELKELEARLTGNPQIDWYTQNQITNLKIQIADLEAWIKEAEDGKESL